MLCSGEPFLGPSSAWEFGAASSCECRSAPSQAVGGSRHPRPRVFPKHSASDGGFLGKELLHCSHLLVSGGLGVMDLRYVIEIEAYRAEIVLIFSGVISGP